MKQAVRNLWELCFHDSPAFTDLYFRLRYRDEVNLAIQNGGEVIAALQLLPYPMTFCGTTIHTSYVSGACTHPDFRGKGVMRELLSEAFEKMYQDGILLSTLIPAEPWLFDYYARSGYAAVFQNGYSYFQGDFSSSLSSEYNLTVSNHFDPQVYAWFAQKMQEKPCSIQHPAEDFNVILADLQLSGGHVYVLHGPSSDKPAAMALAWPEGKNRWLAGELLADTAQEAQTLLQHICRDTRQTTLRLFSPYNSVEKETGKLGMARIIHVHNLLRLYASAYPHTTWNLHITDEQLPANSGYYCLNNGQCTKQNPCPSEHYQHLSVGELADKLLSPLHPYMSLMLN